MRVFICHRSDDLAEADGAVEALRVRARGRAAIERQAEHLDDWRRVVAERILLSDFVVFLLGEDTFVSDATAWEFEEAKRLRKRIVGVELAAASEASILHCEGFPVFPDIAEAFGYMEDTYPRDQSLLTEQYKMMVASTEKVTDQRLRVNNLFMTIVASILSLSVVVGKAFEFSVVGTLAMLLLSVSAFVITFYWKTLVQSYGKLNTGKFVIIDRLEKRLQTNMFDEEWRVLLHEVGYESNSATEAKVVQRFRMFILVVLVLECLYLASHIELTWLQQVFTLGVHNGT